MATNQLPEVEKTLADYDNINRCPKCQSLELATWDHKTVMGKEGVKYREYMICKDCHHLWQWVTRSEIFRPNSEI